jgi:hypothetical protein
MKHTCLSIISCILSALLVFPSPASAFDTPLSDIAVRDAYFLGQRHDDSMARFLDKYSQRFPLPKSGPHIASVTFLTPFALLVDYSSKQSNYSAQQAQIDHRNQAESVKIIVQINFTDSYGPVLSRPSGPRSDSPLGFVLRPYDFWKEFNVTVGNGADILKPFTSYGDPNFLCSEKGGCTLTGATLYFEFLASDFTSDQAIVQIEPPEGDPVSVSFDLTALR